MESAFIRINRILKAVTLWALSTLWAKMNESRFDGIPVMTAASNFRNIEAPPQQTDNYLTRGRLLADAQGPIFRNLLFRGRRFMVSETLPKLSIADSCCGGSRRLDQISHRRDKNRLVDKEKPSKDKSKDEENPQTKKKEIAKIVKEKLNEIREENGLNKVEKSRKETKLATRNSLAQQDKGLGHHLKYSNPGIENAAKISNTNRSAEEIATEIVALWMNSPPHRANILARNAKTMGFDIEDKYATLRLGC